MYSNSNLIRAKACLGHILLGIDEYKHLYGASFFFIESFVRARDKQDMKCCTEVRLELRFSTMNTHVHTQGDGYRMYPADIILLYHMELINVISSLKITRTQMP